MKFMIKWALMLTPVLALATSAFAATPPRDPGLSDATEPGSVIIFPKFMTGTVAVDAGALIPRTEIEIGSVCPPLATYIRNQSGCPAHQAVTVRFHWVCPGAEGVNSNICPEQDFEVTLSVNGKLAFGADGTQLNGNSPIVPIPNCPRGYLIGWVINSSGQPIKWDGLIGNAVIRGPELSTGLSTAVSAYSAITIQANTAQNNGDVLQPGANFNSSFPLIFNNSNNPGTYQAITGVQVGDVRFDRTANVAAVQPDIRSITSVTLLTLDVRSNLPNNPVFVDYDFYNESTAAVSGTNPNFERLLSGTVSFVCWQMFGLTAGPNAIDPNLTQAFMGTRKGVVLMGPAAKESDGNAPNDNPIIGSSDPSPYPVTLIGLVETSEGSVAESFLERKYNFNMQNDSFPVNTTFYPRTSP
jgi:hypothetical protein